MRKGANTTTTARISSPLVDVQLTAYQLTLRGLRLPVVVHYGFNLFGAVALLLLGHPLVAAAYFTAASAIDTVQQRLLPRWLAQADGADEAAGAARLAVLCVARIACYTAAPFAMALRGGLPEFVFYALQVATLLMVAMGAGSLSRATFWSMAGVLLLEMAAFGWLRLAPLEAAAATIGLATLLVLLVMVSETTVRTITVWHDAFLANIALVDDLEAARDGARRADRAKSNFLATMSHEIRTPMNGVLGMAQLLKRDEADPVQAERLDVLIESGEYLLSILNDILDVSKIDAGKLEIALAPEPLRPFLQRLVSFWGARADERGVALSLRISEAVPDAAMVDALRLRQVMFNLLGNALKFTDAGSVELVADAAPLNDGAVQLRLAVRDTGPGIPEHNLPHLFDRFSQADESEVRRFGGTGLGLAIVKQLVELMGGQVWVESAVGLGSTFHVELPLQVVQGEVSPAADLADEAAGPAELQALRVLAVDDNAVNLLVLEQLLTSLGQSVAKASSGAEALAALAAETFDLVLMDIQMPEMSGIEALERLRREVGPNRNVAVVALTADVTSGGRQRYLDLGFDEHAAKPIQLQDLLQAIARATSDDARRAEYAA
ncbi:MAG: response regulator [Caulobacterales bacterium]|nr:response regulator [Caulobacterales bacterium]